MVGRRSLTRACPTLHFLVEIVELEQQLADVPLVTLEAIAQLLGRPGGGLPLQEPPDHFLDHGEGGRRAEEVRQADRGVRGDDQAAVPAPAVVARPQPAPVRQLFIAVDDDNTFGGYAVAAVDLGRELPLAIVELDQPYRPAGQADRRDQRGQERRLAGAMSPDDLSPPAVLPQPLDERGDVLAGGKKIGAGAGTQPAGAKGILPAHFVRAAHEAGALFARTPPNWNGFSPRTSFPRPRKTRTRTHQRILTIAPW